MKKTQEQWIEKYHEMSRIENSLREQGYQLIAGVDEVGRGPLAGPVMAGAVILPSDSELIIPGINDSKQLSEKKRAELFIEIKEKAIAWAVGSVSVEVIDQINILNATRLAMCDAVKQLLIQPQMVLIDAVELKDLKVPQYSMIKGDCNSVSIAAASIAAKETRDAYMKTLDEIYPEYGFAANKGYGTAAHIEALRKYGPTPIHRRTFIKNLI